MEQHRHAPINDSSNRPSDIQRQHYSATNTGRVRPQLHNQEQSRALSKYHAHELLYRTAPRHLDISALAITTLKPLRSSSTLRVQIIYRDMTLTLTLTLFFFLLVLNGSFQTMMSFPNASTTTRPLKRRISKVLFQVLFQVLFPVLFSTSVS